MNKESNKKNVLREGNVLKLLREGMEKEKRMKKEDETMSLRIPKSADRKTEKKK